jgi:hypothetical protein
MKKIIISVSCLLMTIFAFAGGNKGRVEYGILSNGFYLNLGIGMPNTTLVEYNNLPSSVISNVAKKQSLGTQANLEIGNQWYFHTTDNIGIGLRVSWLQFGYSAFNNVYQPEVTGSAFDTKLVKVAPMFTYAVNEDFGIDASFEVAPSILFMSEQESLSIGGSGDKVGTVLFGATFAPGIKLRYTMFCLGYDYSFGTLSGSGTMPYEDNVVMSQKVSNSRIYLGLKF